MSVSTSKISVTSPQQLDGLIAQVQSADKQQREQAQAFFDQVRLTGETPATLLQYVTSGEQFSEPNRQFAAIVVKNVIKRRFGQHTFTHYEEQQRREDEAVAGDEEDPVNFVDAAGLALLQEHLVSLLMGCPSRPIASQFLEMVALMGKRNVHKDWPALVPTLAQHLQGGDLARSRLALECVKKICKKYRFMFRSDALYIEMNYIIEQLSAPLLQALLSAVQQQDAPAAPHDELLLISNAVLHVFESVLSQEELPDFYEENLPAISQACTALLQREQPQSAALQKAQTKVVRLVHLYQSKFGEYFKQYQDHFFQQIWALVTRRTITASKSCERLLFALVRYLGDCAAIPTYSDFLAQNLQAIIEILVLPSISITQEDIDEFEDDPQAYIRNDLEESDVETRRRTCMKFL